MIYIDFETRSKCDLKTAGAWRYSQDPSTQVLCMAWAVDDGDVQLWHPKDGAIPHKVFGTKDHVFEAHNAAFEKAIWENVLGWLPVKWECSLAKCAAHSLPRALGGAGEALGLDVQKDEEGRRVMMKLCRPRKPTKNNPSIWHEDPADLDILYKYCMDDVRAERALSKALRGLNPLEQKVWEFDQMLNERGIKVDIDAVDSAIKVTEDYVKNCNEQIAVLTDGKAKKATETKKLTEWIQSHGVPTAGVTKSDVAQMLNTVVPDVVRSVLEIRQKVGKTSVAKYKKIKKAVSEGDRLRGMLMYHGASTGRWTGKTVQLHNLPRNGIKGNLEDTFNILKQKNLSTFELCYPDVMNTVSQMIRPCLIPSEGMKFYGGDYSSIEARVLLWLADEQEGLDIFRSGECIYRDMASTIYKKPASTFAKDSIERQLGKQAILGLGYGMGTDTFLKTCLGYGMNVDIALAEKVKETYRAKYKKVVALWYDQERAAMKAIKSKKFISCGKIGWGICDDFLYCKLPSKRLIAYYAPKVEAVTTPWGATKKGITFMSVNPTTKKWERTKTYGGMIVENITQGVARDMLAEALLRLEDGGYRVVHHTHDEAIAEHTHGNVGEFESIMVKNPEWGLDIPTDVEGWEGERYLK